VGFFRFPGVSLIFGTSVMARRTGLRDRCGAGFPAWWPTAAPGAARVGDGPGAGGAGGIRGTCAEGERGENDRGFPKGINELSGEVLKIRVN
jgi:hypothetical protein